MPKEARFYLQRDNALVQCSLCPRNCEIKPGERGHCKTRENRNGKLYSLVYGYPVTMNNDPIEKKPFYHVYPGSKSFSIATAGCNFDCKFCQNWEISQKLPEEVSVQYMRPLDIARLAKHYGARTVAYTYNEPSILSEYVIDCAMAARDMGIGNVMVSNGYINEAPQAELMDLLTAYKVDLKAFSQVFYAEYCKGRIKPVLETLQRLAGHGVWYEIVVLVIPTLNDDADEIKRMCEWIVSNLGDTVPVHFTRFHPRYKLKNLPPTPPKTLQKVHKIAISSGCKFVYTGNMPGIGGETLCPKCRNMVIRRYGNFIESNSLNKNECPHCTSHVPGVWF
ncbi:AmmeMemoRadiSam system radical SAM enzyme [bacterium E08(2017)]|nr:AmmeMemoRadiSam system radical SAM enzyme [bacterium E08(2017)]